MNVSVLIFLLVPVILVLLLAWLGRPPKSSFHSPSEMLDALARDRHYSRLPQILQALREEDIQYLQSTGKSQLAARARSERVAVAAHYLNCLEQEYQVLLEASRMLSAMAPELSAIGEFDRFQRSLRFMFCCRYLRWKLRLGLQPWNAIGLISDMAGDMTLQLEAATGRLGERAMFTYDTSSAEGRGHSKSN
ncbi:MAG TPA: hypothetical protein VMJ35_07990 [Dongiaceae bacterium]|nr:hypothetical protein [Dongiaceae bacterium]